MIKYKFKNKITCNAKIIFFSESSFKSISIYVINFFSIIYLLTLFEIFLKHFYNKLFSYIYISSIID